YLNLLQKIHIRYSLLEILALLPQLHCACITGVSLDYILQGLECTEYLLKEIFQHFLIVLHFLGKNNLHILQQDHDTLEDVLGWGECFICIGTQLGALEQCIEPRGSRFGSRCTIRW
ncbi:hypothetical protein C8F01DRAFT_1130737, partial [Mycena amicta]